SVSNILASVQKMEMELLQAPSKLAAQLDKEINHHKKQENKLQNALNKVNKRLNATEARLNSYKEKTSAAGKKQLKKVTKLYNKVSDAHADLSDQLNAVNNILETLLDKQTKFISLGKNLSQLNKEWAKSAKNAKVKSKPQAKKVKSKEKIKLEPTSAEQIHI